MSVSASRPFSPARRGPFYSAVSTNEGHEYLPDEFVVSSLSEQNWKDQRQELASDPESTVLESKDLSLIDLYESPFRSNFPLSRFGSVRERWNRSSSGVRSRLPTGWRFGAWLATFQAGLVLSVNIIILIWSALKAGGGSSGIVYQGDCNKVDHYSIGIHLVINILSTLLLGASNYMMQSLCAPTRAEVDRAHARGLWLDIGLQSLRNLKYMSRRKRILWIALSMSSIPLHLIYNSSFFSTLSANEYLVYPVQGPDLQTVYPNADGRYNWTCGSQKGCPGGAKQTELSQWNVLSNSECLQAYANDFVSDRLTVVPVVGDYTSNGSLLVAGYGSKGTSLDPYEWICSGMDNFSEEPALCSSVWRNIDPSNWKYRGYIYNSTSSERVLSIHYCLSEPVVPKCQLEFNLPLLIIVILFNIVKVGCMAFAAVKIKDDALVTIGDAIASFTGDPDPHTPSRRHWITTVSLFAAAISIVLGLLIYAVINLKANGITGFSGLSQFGIGKPHAQNIITGWNIPVRGYSALVSAVLISNSPQLILSVIYLVFNSLCTRMFLALEWASYSRSRKSLRVSSPDGKQRSTYFLQIPYRFGLPLMAYSALLHWLVSQSIFLVKVTYWYGTDATGDENTTSCGYSPLGMILTIIVGTTLILGAFIVAFFTRINGEMPLVGSCSAAISASCHPPLTDGSDSLKPMKWGSVVGAEDEDNKLGSVGHVTFSSGAVVKPTPGFYYS
ncbi:hypothetical protein D9757_005580 [Collybiopsis confluens]|uniref:DUF6536 domain-containing protein n=1 Tax=Collybiopsis confluens TaxID=2823264 RepID=A0A8H5HTB1_9AGAR|nr:hypothetical protein D9757_005580 [Collybiopsis confluens]